MFVRKLDKVCLQIRLAPDAGIIRKELTCIVKPATVKDLPGVNALKSSAATCRMPT